MDTSFYGISDFLQTTLPTMGVSLVEFLGQLLLAVVLFVIFWVIGVSTSFKIYYEWNVIFCY